jgi:putative hemolysin
VRHRRLPLLLAFMVLIAGLSACGSDDVPSDTSSSGTTASGTGLANPASVFCVEQGGTVEIVDEAGGQVGYCTLPDGARIDEWEYFRAESGEIATTEP